MEMIYLRTLETGVSIATLQDGPVTGDLPAHVSGYGDLVIRLEAEPGDIRLTESGDLDVSGGVGTTDTRIDMGSSAYSDYRNGGYDTQAEEPGKAEATQEEAKQEAGMDEQQPAARESDHSVDLVQEQAQASAPEPAEVSIAASASGAAGVALLGLGTLLGSSRESGRSAVFDPQSGTWQLTRKRGKGVRVRLTQEEDLQDETETEHG